MDTVEDIVQVKLDLEVTGKYEFETHKRYRVPMSIARTIEKLLLEAETKLLEITSK